VSRGAWTIIHLTRSTYDTTQSHQRWLKQDCLIYILNIVNVKLKC
jgi:hypothetical protein